MYLCTVVGFVFLRVDTGVVLIGDAIQADRCLALVEMKAVSLDIGL